MSIDMSEFYGVFFEEAAELLGEMEILLLDLDLENPDHEALNAIFRVAHSIKGGAATFGFTDMAEVTHVLESLLDRLRNNELKIRPDMVDAFLEAGDVVKAQLAGHRGEGEPDPAAAKAIREKLKSLAEGKAVDPAPAAAPSPSMAKEDPELEGVGFFEPIDEAPAEVVPADDTSAANTRDYHIEFVFKGTSASLENLFANLADLGAVTVIKGPERAGDQPVADNVVLDPCVLNIKTAVSEEDLWEALAFIVDPNSIKVEPLSADEAAMPKADDSFGFFEPLYEAVTGLAAAPVAAAAEPVVEAKPVVSAPVVVAEPAAVEMPKLRWEDDPSHKDKPNPNGRRESDKLTGDATSIRVNIEKVDQLINLVGELVITQAMLAQAASTVDPILHEALIKGMGQLDRNTRDLQESVMSIRMMPISFVFSRFPRLVRDLAGKLNKQVELKTIGENTELDKGLIEKIADPLTHLVRNSLDHGVESPEKRLAAGKPAKGTITLRAFHQGGNIVIEVGDDGAGLNREKILAKARAQGMPVSDSMSDQDVWALIFEAGFSTAEVVTDVSGRGVGMDVVRRNIQALGGSVEIDSALGVGTRMSIRLPLTLAILDGLSVAVGEETFIVPLTYIVESLQPRMEDVKTVGNGDMVIHVRGEYLPIVKAKDFFGVRGQSRDINDGIIVILEADGAKKALLVDELLGQHQVVIKSLETNYRRVRGISGATIMGNGRVALILDVGAIVRGANLRLLQAA